MPMPAERLGVFSYAGLFGKAKPNDRSAPESLRTGPGSFRGIGIGERQIRRGTGRIEGQDLAQGVEQHQPAAMIGQLRIRVRPR